MSLNPSRVAISRTGWMLYAIVEVALFIGANFTAKNSSHPGTVSNVFFITFIVGLVLAVLLGAATLIRQRSAMR
jgi:F420-0:gamma-glutamyl ligase-like protein